MKYIYIYFIYNEQNKLVSHEILAILFNINFSSLLCCKNIGSNICNHLVFLFFRNSLNWNAVPTLIYVGNNPPKLTPNRRLPTQRTTAFAPKISRREKVATVQDGDAIDNSGMFKKTFIFTLSRCKTILLFC